MIAVLAVVVAAVGAPAPAARVPVIVLDVDGDTVARADRDALSAAIAARLQTDAALDVRASSSPCAHEACVALARDAGASLLVSAHVERVGPRLVVSVGALDVSAGAPVVAATIDAASVDDACARSGTTAVRVVAPLADAALRRETPGALRVCGTSASWSVCDGSRRYSDAAFARKYRDATGAHDLDAALTQTRSHGYATSALYMSLAAAGAAGATGVAVCATTTTCGSDLHDTLTRTPTASSVPFGVGVTAFGIGVVEAALSWPNDDALKDDASEHALARATAARAADRYNLALDERRRR